MEPKVARPLRKVKSCQDLEALVGYNVEGQDQPSCLLKVTSELPSWQLNQTTLTLACQNQKSLFEMKKMSMDCDTISGESQHFANPNPVDRNL